MGLMAKLCAQRFWHQLFRYGIFVKGFLGIWEIMLGSALLFAGNKMFFTLTMFLSQHELKEDPEDIIVSFLDQASQHILFDAKLFATIYILAHGILNIFLAIQLYRNRYWAYVAAITVMVSFVLYQVYRIGVHHSFVLVAVTLLDIFFIFLTWREYMYQKKHTLKNDDV